MKVLFTVSTYYPKKDGVQNVTGYLAEGLAKLGHEVTVITSNKDNNALPEEIYNGVKILRINLYTKYGLYFGEKQEYRKIIYDYANKVDVMINVCTQNAFTDLILNDLSKYKCKKILYLHGIFNFGFTKLDFTSIRSITNKLWKEVRWFFYYLFNGKNFKKYDTVTQLHSEDYGNIFFKKHFNIDSVIIENATSEEFFDKNTEKDFSKPFNKYMIYVANYDDNKNQKLAIKEFLKSNIDKNIGLVLIGSKKNKYYYKLEKAIQSYRKKYRIKNNEKPITMLYEIDRKLISSYVKSANLFLMTSKGEKFPMSLVESMACGIPFISTDVGIAKYLPGGIISNKQLIHKQIDMFFNNENIYKKYGEIGFEFSKENFKIDEKVKLLDKIINGRAM